MQTRAQVPRLYRPILTIMQLLRKLHWLAKMAIGLHDNSEQKRCINLTQLWLTNARRQTRRPTESVRTPTTLMPTLHQRSS